VNKKSIPNFLDVFEKRVEAARQRIKEELKKDKKDRDKENLKLLLKEVKDIRKSVREAKKEHIKVCPHCGHVL
jgi:hypothetical protein